MLTKASHTMNLFRLVLLLFALVIGSVVMLIGFEWISAEDVRLFGWCGLGIIVLALAALLRE